MLRKLMFLIALPLALQAEEIRIVHYNIKELDSVKLQQGAKNPQLAAALAVLKKLKPDFLSINEMQYDLPGVPTKAYQSEGQNMSNLVQLLSLKWPQLSVGFGPANTGFLALKIPGTNEYTTNTMQRELADPINFGVFPAEYSSGGATRFPVVKRIFEQKLKWKDFRPDRDLSKLKDASGKFLDPETVELFDKNFMDMVVQIAGREVHFILLHTVPAHDFGNEGSPNSVRNADQLSFLEWYLTGTTDFEPPVQLKIKPLKPGTLFVAMGDWNVDVANETLPGASILRRLFQKTNLWMKQSELRFTYESQPFYLPPFQEQLDYMITSQSPELTIKAGGVYAPFERNERGCSLAAVPKDPKKGYVMVSYRDTKTKETCYAEVSADYAEIKKASDHRPLWMDLEIK
ncbi:MAG: hypothetical protein ACXWC9_02010 [Pseudobdellovibrionaceae bacterium]